MAYDRCITSIRPRRGYLPRDRTKALPRALGVGFDVIEVVVVVIAVVVNSSSSSGFVSGFGETWGRNTNPHATVFGKLMHTNNIEWLLNCFNDHE